jgi:hypothetical protein
MEELLVDYCGVDVAVRPGIFIPRTVWDTGLAASCSGVVVSIAFNFVSQVFYCQFAILVWKDL